MKKSPFSIPRVAWMGGCTPMRGNMCPAERSLTREAFRAQCREWSGYWRTPVPLDVARIFWNRARHDAYASVREYARQTPATARRDRRLIGFASRA